MLAWAIGTSLAALGGILLAPGSALDAPSLSLLIVSASAAAIFGRLRSLPLTFLGAVVVGCAEGYLTGYLPQNQYLSGLRLAIPAIILFVVLLVLPNPRMITASSSTPNSGASTSRTSASAIGAGQPQSNRSCPYVNANSIPAAPWAKLKMPVVV
jgi:branched-chain amino acid transport system permease protein